MAFEFDTYKTVAWAISHYLPYVGVRWIFMMTLPTPLIGFNQFIITVKKQELKEKLRYRTAHG